MTDVLPGRITRAAIHCEAGELEVRLAQGGSWQLHLRRAADREWRLACGGDLEAGTPTPQAPPPDHPIGLGSLRIDPAGRRAWFDGVEVILGRLEFALLSRLASDPSRVFTKDQLLRDIWGCEVDMSAAAHFEGEIPGPHNDDVTIVLQVKSGKGWLAFRRYRTRADGHYDLEYPFRRTTRPTTYEMRAQVRETTGYPYEQGDSDPLLLRVVPGRAKTSPAHSTRSRRPCEGRARHRSHTVKARCAKRHSKARGAR